MPLSQIQDSLRWISSSLRSLTSWYFTYFRIISESMEILDLAEGRCGTCGEIRPEEAVWDLNEKGGKPAPGARPVFDPSSCVSCNMCIQICRNSCLSLSEANSYGLHRIPYLEKPSSCISCGFCAEDCPVDAISMVSDMCKEPRAQ